MNNFQKSSFTLLYTKSSKVIKNFHLSCLMNLNHFVKNMIIPFTRSYVCLFFSISSKAWMQVYTMPFSSDNLNCNSFTTHFVDHFYNSCTLPKLPEQSNWRLQSGSQWHFPLLGLHVPWSLQWVLFVQRKSVQEK